MKKSFYEKSLKTARIFFIAALCFSLSGLNTFASSHAEAPLTSQDRYADNTDVYAFRSNEAGRAGFVTLIANFIPLQDPSGGPQFYRFDDTVLYEIKIDNTGDGTEDVTYQFQFFTQILNQNTVLGMSTINVNGQITSLADLDYNMPQSYNVRLINSATGPGGMLLNTAGPLRMPPSNIGPRVTPNYEANLAQPAIYNIGTAGARVFCGQRDEAFSLDLGVFDAIGYRSVGPTGGVDTLRTFNVNTIALEVPISALTRGGVTPTSPTDPAAVIGVFSTASRGSLRTIANNGDRSQTGRFVQVSRLGSPLVNEVVIPLGLKDAFNSLSPRLDGTIPQVVSSITDPEFPKIVRLAIGAFGTFSGGGLPVINLPPAPRNDLVAIFGTGIPAGAVPGAPTFTTFLSDGTAHEYLRLNVAIAPVTVGMTGYSRLGLLGGDIGGFPNGRRVTDDVVDIEIRALLGGTPFTPAFNVSPNNAFSDGVSTNFEGYLTRFPYLQTPNAGNTERPANFPSLLTAPREASGEEQGKIYFKGFPDLTISNAKK